MSRRNFLVAVAALACAALIIVNLTVGTPQKTQKSGRQIFRFDTFLALLPDDRSYLGRDEVPVSIADSEVA